MHRVVKVEMLAFGEPGEIREVLIEVQPNMTTLETLGHVFHFGQNDFQPQKHPSVSVGDVIVLDDSKYVVAPIGFRKLSEDDYKGLVALERRDRHFAAYDDGLGTEVV